MSLCVGVGYLNKTQVEDAEPGAGEASRADAWRRAWGLPPLDVEDEEEQK